MDNENQIIDENDENAVWEDFLDELFALDYEQVDDILEIERRIYQSLQQKPNELSGLITLMYCQIMLGNREKAVTLANRIWEIGGNLDTFFEFVYIEGLLNLGLLEMASVLLKPRFENLRDNLEIFYPSLAKFAVMTGNTALINRIAEYPELGEDEDILFELADVYTETQNSGIFKNIMKLILENVSGHQCSYEYELFDDRGFPEIVIIVYVNESDAFCERLQSEIENKITGLWLSSGQKQMNNIGISVVRIQEHEGWNVEDEGE